LSGYIFANKERIDNRKQDVDVDVDVDGVYERRPTSFNHFTI